MGCTISVLNNNGNIKLKGAIFWRQLPYGLPHKDDVGKVSKKPKKTSVPKASKPKKISAPRVSESPIQLDELVDTDNEDGGDNKPVLKFSRLTFDISSDDKYDDDDGGLVINITKKNVKVIC